MREVPQRYTCVRLDEIVATSTKIVIDCKFVIRCHSDDNDIKLSGPSRGIDKTADLLMLCEEASKNNKQKDIKIFTNRPSAANEDLRSHCNAGSLAGVHGDRERLQQSALFQGNTIGKFETKVRRVNVKTA